MTYSNSRADLRLAIYRQLAATGEVHTPASLAAEFEISPTEAAAELKLLASEDDAIVLLPDSPYIWMAEPFSAVATDYKVTAKDGRHWFGNCIWDALAIGALLDTETEVETRCPFSNEALTLSTNAGELSGSTSAVVQFAVPARDWWKSIGFS